jgi:hypothetical protein
VLATKFAQLAWVTRRVEQEYKRAHLERGRTASAVQLETPGA